MTAPYMRTQGIHHTAALAQCFENSGWALKEMESKDYQGLAEQRNQRETARRTRFKRRERCRGRKQNRERKEKPIKICVLNP